MRSPTSDSRRRPAASIRSMTPARRLWPAGPSIGGLTRAASLGGLLWAGLLLDGCGGARAPVETPSVEPPPVAGALIGLPAILLDPAPPAALDPFGVNPTVAVAARPTARFAPLSDRIGYRAAWDRLGVGRLPAPDPAGFVDAVADDGPGPLLRSAVMPSPWRRGYHCLRVALVPPERPLPPAAVIVIEARRGLIGATEREALRVVFERAERPARLGLLVAGERPSWVLRPGIEHAPESWRAAIDGLQIAGPADVSGGVRAARAALPPDGLVVLVAEGRPPTADPVARIAAGADFASALDGVITRRLWAREATLEVRFDPRAVDRYRLIGFDGGGAGGEGGALWAGRPTAAVFEVHLIARDLPLGELRLRAHLPGGEALVVTASLTDGTDAADPETRRRVQVAALAAAVAERLRASWWARGIEWAGLRAAAEALAPDPGAGRMLEWIERASALDDRPDRFAEHGPADGMDPHGVPILRGIR